MLKCLLSKFIKFVTSKKITSNLTFKYNKSTSEKTKPLEMIGKQPSCMLRYNYEVQWQWLLVRKINSLKCLPLDIHYMVAGSRYRSWTMVGMSWLHPTLCLQHFISDNQKREVGDYEISSVTLEIAFTLKCFQSEKKPRAEKDWSIIIVEYQSLQDIASNILVNISWKSWVLSAMLWRGDETGLVVNYRKRRESLTV